MITIKQLAEKFEYGLNGVLQNDEIKFKIWADAGEYKKPVREGNVIIHEIVGNLRTSSSSNDANNVLVMGINGLSLDFMIPIVPPRTNATQTAEQLAKISDGQYPFLTLITSAINEYFQEAQSFTEKDGEGTEFSVAFQAGVANTGSVELAAKYGNAVPYNVFIQVYFIEGGTNSKDIEITVDGKPMPFQSVRPGRAAVAERDVFSGEAVSKCTVSSTAFTLDADFPSSKNPATQTAINYLLGGEANTAHFVGIKWGNVADKLFFMTYNTVQGSATGIAIAGISASFMEVNGNDKVYNLPDGFNVIRFEFENSQEQTLSFTLSEECQTFIAGVGTAVCSGAQTVQLSANSFEYDENINKYVVNLIVDRAVTITGNSATII